MYIYTCDDNDVRPPHPLLLGKGGMIRLETLVELRFLNSVFSSSNISIRVFRVCRVPCFADGSRETLDARDAKPHGCMDFLWECLAQYLRKHPRCKTM